MKTQEYADFELLEMIVEDDKKYILEDDDGPVYLEKVLEFYHNHRKVKTKNYLFNMAADRGLINEGE